MTTDPWSEPEYVAPKRRRRLPFILLALTCLSVFWAGVWRWAPHEGLLGGLFGFGADGVGAQPAILFRLAVLRNGGDAVAYMACLLAILLTHEMGHFLMSVRYRVPASLPFFLPLPISPIGTLGAVIAMDGRRADRREIFDIGIAGPLAGLIVAIPILWLGLERLDFTVPAGGSYALDLPLAVRWWLDWRQPPGYVPGADVYHSQLNPYFMAGWVGLLVTGLNMMPVSQLDGGHVVHGLFGRPGRWIARLFMVVAIGNVIWNYFAKSELSPGLIMLVLILLMGTDHPPTRDDTRRLGLVRMILGAISLLIPLLCFPPKVIYEF